MGGACSVAGSVIVCLSECLIDWVVVCLVGSVHALGSLVDCVDCLRALMLS